MGIVTSYYTVEEAIAQITDDNPEDALLTLLKEDRIKAEGRLFDPNKMSGPNDENVVEGPYEPIPPEHWSDWEFDWVKKKLSYLPDQTSYVSIRIKKLEFYKNKGGRPPQYNWANFYIELSAYVDSFDLKKDAINAAELKNLRDRMVWFDSHPNGGPESDDIKDQVFNFLNNYEKHAKRFRQRDKGIPKKTK